MPDRFYGTALTGLLDTLALERILESLEDGVAELMCHPGDFDADLQQTRTRLQTERAQEVHALVGESLRRLVRDRQIRLINYRELD